MSGHFALKLISPRVVLALNAIMILGMAFLLFWRPTHFTSSAGVLFPFVPPVLTVYSYIIRPPSKVLARISMGLNIFTLLAGIGFIFISAAFSREGIFSYWPILLFFVLVPLVSALSLSRVGAKRGP